MGLPPSIGSRTANSRLRSWRARAIRYRNLARSLPGSPAQSESHALLAAVTARSTSSGPASATSASFSSLEGSMVSKYRPDRGSTNLPPMNRPYRSWMDTMSLDSGAGAYSQAVARWGRRSLPGSMSFPMASVDREVVRPLVRAGPLLVDLHQHIVQQRRRADSEQIRRHPLPAERLVQEHQVLDGLLRLADAARHLHPHLPAGLVEEVPGRLHHAQGRRQRGPGPDLAGRGLDEVGAR